MHQSYENLESDTDDGFHYCGEYTLRAEKGGKDVSDGINGTMTLRDDDMKAVGAKPGSRIRLRVKHEDKTAETERQIHASGRTVTFPLNERQKLGLEPGDSVEYWIKHVEPPGEQTALSEDEEEDSQEDYIAVIAGEFTYHYVSSKTPQQTLCGRSLEDREFRVGGDPGDVFEECEECAVIRSDSVSNEQLVKWLGKQAGFEPSDGNPAYFNKEQLLALRDHILELRQKAEDQHGD